MSYQVIARKYRPQRFEDVVGQEHVTATLANAIRSNRIAHAYLFCGPRGTGKTTIARIFAKALNCTGGPKADFDDSDPRCQEITEGRSLDVLEIDGASNNGVEQVRELRDTARFAPAASRFKIYIIDEVHMLTTAAFNALLKTLEEPPAHVKFLFATTDPEKVLPTILSRCQRFDLRRIPAALIVKHLSSIARQEGVQIDDAALHAIARGADGGMRDAESTLDQLISFCGEKIEESDVLSMFGLTARSQIFALAAAILRSDAPSVLKELNELAQGGKDLGRLLDDLLHHLRNLVVLQIAEGDLTLLDVPEHDAVELREQAKLAPPEAVTRVLEELAAAEGRLRDAIARKIFLEVTLLRAIQARNSVSLDTVLKHLEQLRREGSDGGSSSSTRAEGGGPPVQPRASGPARPETTDVSRTAPSPSASTLAPPPEKTAHPGPIDPAAAWSQVIAGATPMTRPSLQAGEYVGLEKGVLSIGYSPAQDSLRALVDNERTRKALESRLGELGCPVTVKFVRLANSSAASTSTAAQLSSNEPAVSAQAPRAAIPESQTPESRRPRAEKVTPLKIDPTDFKQDPLIMEALEVFKGHIVEVRPPTGGNGNSTSMA